MADVTQTPDQLPALAALSPDAGTIVWEPGGPTSKIPIKLLLGRLISTEEATETVADLTPLLDYAPNALALVYADPDLMACGWYRKTGVAGQGGWVQFETLAKATRDSLITLSGHGPPDPLLGATYQFYRDLDGEAEYGPKTAAGWGDPRPLRGPAGGANATFMTVDEIAAAPTTNLSAILSPAAGSGLNPSTYHYQDGDFTGRTDTIQSDDVPIAQGAWVAQAAAGVTYGRSNIVLPLDRSLPRTLAYLTGVDPFTVLSQQSLLEDALAIAAAERFTVLAHPDANYRHDGPLEISTSIDWQGATLTALSDGYNHLYLTGDGLQLRNLTHLGGASARANGDDRNNGLTGQDLTNFLIENVTCGSVDGVKGFGSAGMLLRRCRDGVMRNTRVLRSNADGQHVTGGCERVTFYSPYVYQSGDDAFPIVDYAQDTLVSCDIRYFGATAIETRARGVAYVGGKNCTHYSPRIFRTSAAAVYYASEASYDTLGPDNCKILDFYAENCVTGVGLDPSFSNAILLLAGRAGSVAVANSIGTATRTVLRPVVSGKIAGSGDRASCGANFQDVNVIEPDFDVIIDNLGGTMDGVQAGGTNSRGVFKLYGIPGGPFKLLGGAGRHRYAISASGTRTSNPANVYNITHEGANGVDDVLYESIDLENAPGQFMSFYGPSADKVRFQNAVWNGARQDMIAAVAFANGWGDPGGAEPTYCTRSIEGRGSLYVHATGGAANDNTTILTLPVGFRPASVIIFSDGFIPSGNNPVYQLSPSGDLVLLFHGGGGNELRCNIDYRLA